MSKFCLDCGEEPIQFLKRQLCEKCYIRNKRHGTLDEFPRIGWNKPSRFPNHPEGNCHLCGRWTVLEYDHLHVYLKGGPLRGMLCVSCNRTLGWVEKIGLDAIVGYLTASSIGGDFRDVHRERTRERARKQRDKHGAWPPHKKRIVEIA